MASVNSVILLGHLTRDPELRYTPQGVPVASFAVAVNRRVTSKEGARQDRATFVDVEAWGRLGEITAGFLKKGCPVVVLGELRQDRWEDKASGMHRSKLYIVAKEVQFLGGKGSEGAEPLPEESVQAEE